jgi:hypothetical protein
MSIANHTSKEVVRNNFYWCLFVRNWRPASSGVDMMSVRIKMMLRLAVSQPVLMSSLIWGWSNFNLYLWSYFCCGSSSFEEKTGLYIVKSRGQLSRFTILETWDLYVMYTVCCCEVSQLFSNTYAYNLYIICYITSIFTIYTAYKGPLSVQNLQSSWYLILHSLYYNLVTWTVISLTAAKLKPVIFSAFYGFHFLPCCEYLHFHDFEWLLLAAFIILLHNHTHTGGWKPYANRELVCALENYRWCRKLCFAGAAMSINLPAANTQAGQVWILMDLMSALWRVEVMLAFSRLFSNREYALINVL